MGLKRKHSHSSTTSLSVVWLGLLVSLLFLATACKRDNTSTSGVDPAMRQQRGAEVVAEFLKRDSSPYRKNRVRMTIADPSEPMKVYELEIWRKQTPDETLTLTHVVQPADESDLAALSIERKGQPAVNVTYVSSTGEFRETGTNKMFFGGLTAQELLGEWDKYSYEWLGDKELDGVKTYEVEGQLKPGSDSILKRSRILFRADTYQPAEVHLFSADGSELRTFKVKTFRNVAGHDVMWQTDIENHARKTKITIESQAVEFPEKANDAMFTRDHLKQIAQRKT
ncbi:MAG TPA: outer membrane lipoprotein-sorting protein [Pyrinomonadaceae bacterium]|nr:outer membrane lipoprotein-sorting protein [Pyrinomonadaceae bacterium]